LKAEGSSLNALVSAAINWKPSSAWGAGNDDASFRQHLLDPRFQGNVRRLILHRLSFLPSHRKPQSVQEQQGNYRQRCARSDADAAAEEVLEGHEDRCAEAKCQRQQTCACECGRHLHRFRRAVAAIDELVK
jgi:hypothetical protein